ncbi:MAG TPA: SGNH/GDSL hydrolase family protein [Bryobacteraceae bacterium]|jgi:lysophospholipase L1-like esterase|nr:SGNH/GDSL hydrolase family protein [Bryobacteraceae bacterium]
MRFRPLTITAFCLAGTILSFPASSFQTATARKRKPAPTTAVRITAVARAAAAAKVDQYLDDSAGISLYQPGALVPVFEQLSRLSAGDDPKSLHIIHFGDSHTAADEWTGGLRDLFKQKFGDGGSGFSVAGRPFPGYRRFDARGGASTLWHSYGGRAGTGDGYFGLGGVSIFSSIPGQYVYLDAECGRLEIDYLLQPGGGSLALYDNDQRIDQISTDGELGPGFSTYDIAPGPHRFKLVTLSARPVRLFGWAADRNTGVTYEALGLNGAEAAVIGHWNEQATATYLQHRNPGLIVLAYGTNEATDPAWDADSYQAMFTDLLDRLRRAVPTASILVVGPGDRWRYVRGRWQIVDGIDKIVAAQQLTCKEHGCAFWDTRGRMGGKGAMRDWVNAGLAQADHVHFTSAGYHRLAAVMYSDLMQQFDAYRKNRAEMGVVAAHGHANQDH